MQLSGAILVGRDTYTAIDGGPIKYASDRQADATGYGPRIGGHDASLIGQANVYSFYQSVADQIAAWMDALHSDVMARGAPADTAHPSYFAMVRHDAHWNAYSQGYTEATNIESVRWSIVDDYLNQPALRAARGGGRIDVMGLPQARDAIALEQGNATAREQAQHRNPWDPSFWLADAIPWIMIATVGLAAWALPAAEAAAGGVAASEASTSSASAASVAASDGVQVFALQTAPATVTDVATGATTTFQTVTGSSLVGSSSLAPVASASILASGGAALMPQAPPVDPSMQQANYNYGSPSPSAGGAAVTTGALQNVAAGASAAATLKRLFSPVSSANAAQSRPGLLPAPTTLPGQSWFDPIPIAPGTQPSAIDWLRSPGWAGLPVWLWLAGGAAGILLLSGRRSSPAPTQGGTDG